MRKAVWTDSLDGGRLVATIGTLYGKIGRSGQARAELSTSIEMYRDMEMAFWLPETKAALAEVEGQV